MRAILILALLSSFVVGGQILDAVSAASPLPAEDLRSITFTATGRTFVLGQSAGAADPWPPVTVRSYQAAIDYTKGAMRVEEVLAQVVPQPHGGSPAFEGERRQVLCSLGGFAWNETLDQGGSSITSQPAAIAERTVWTWAAAPQGLTKLANTAAARTRPRSGDLSLVVGGRYRVVVTLDRAGQITRARTSIPNDVLGDMLLEVNYSDYRSFGSIAFPSHIVMRQGGHPVLDLAVTSVRTNEPVAIAVPDSVRTMVQAPVVQSTKLGDGIFWFTGSAEHSMAVDMGDHVVVIEAPGNEARSIAVIAEVKKLIPSKLIRYVVNTHVHFDHAGGLRTYVNEGAIVVTHPANQGFLEKAWKAPRTLEPDLLSRSGKKWVFRSVTDRLVLQGSNKRTIELHILRDNPHNHQILFAWLPSDSILFQSDMLSAPANPTVLAFYDALKRLKIRPEHLVSGHGTRVSTMATLDTIVANAKK